MSPIALARRQVLPVVFIVYLAVASVLVTVGVPRIVNILPDTLYVTPVGKPEIVTSVAPPPRSYWIGSIGVLIQTDWAVSPPALKAIA